MFKIFRAIFVAYTKFKFSACTLWINFSSDFEFIWAPVFGFGVLTAQLSPNFALKCSFKSKISPEIENGSLNELQNWSLNNLIETPVL